MLVLNYSVIKQKGHLYNERSNKFRYLRDLKPVEAVESKTPETPAERADQMIETLLRSAKRTTDGDLVDPDIVVYNAEALVELIKKEYPHVFNPESQEDR